MTDEKKTAPAAGEATAIGGYLRQYEYSATCVYRAMRTGALEGVVISDVDAGLFDDVVMETSDGVLGVQVKSTRASRYVNLGTELSEDFVKSLVESWKKLRAKYPDRKLTVRYIFPALFSDQDTALGGKSFTGRKDSAAFAEFLSEPVDGEVAAESAWAEKFDELKRWSGLSEIDFWSFVNSLQLCDERELLGNRIENFETVDSERITALRNLLPALVADPKSHTRWTDSDLAKRLGWNKRLVLRNIHEFPVPEDYQGNPVTEAAIAQALAGVTQGYVALVGPPGTGKSTLLQRTIYSTPELGVSRYLAFHPDERNGLGRAEASSFLNDLVAELRALGLGGNLYYLDNVGAVRTELIKQLNEASRRYAETGRKTLVLIDGLDHVPREETPLESFLPQLPAANSVPEGVVFLLGTQRLDLPGLHPTIIQQASEQGRNVEIQPLPRAAIFEMARIAGLSANVDRSELFEASKGHPLMARYFVEALKGASDEEEARRILSLDEGLGKSTEQIYERVWQKLDPSPSAKHALGLLSRAEADLCPEQLASQTSDASVEEMLAKAGFLLSKPAEGRLSMFHNSFRLFSARETGKKFGRPNDEVENAFYAQLAKVASVAPADDSQHWMELRYHARSKNFDEVRRLGTAEYFRHSLAAFRPSADVASDLRFTFAAVKPTRDRVLLLERLLIGKEIDYRLEAVSNLDLVSLFMDVGDYDLALKHALAGDGGTSGWVQLIDALWHDGHRELARQVFEMNEPLDVIMGDGTYDPSHDRTVAESWARCAHRFRPPEKLIELVNSVSPRSGIEDESHLRLRLRHKLAQGIVGDLPDTDIDDLCRKYDLGPTELVTLLIESAEGLVEAGNREKAVAALSRASDELEFVELHPSWRRFAARIAWRVREKELTLKIVRTLTIPRLERVLGESTGESSDAHAEDVFETALLSELTGAKIVEELVGVRSERSVILTTMHEKLIQLAKARAASEQGRTVESATAIKASITYFARTQPSAGDYQAYKFYGSLGWLAKTLVRLSRRLPDDAARDLIATVNRFVEQSGSNFANSTSFRTAFAEAVFAYDQDQKAASHRLKAAEEQAAPERTPHAVVDVRADFARAYAAVGLHEDAQRSLNAMHEDTFGYWLRAKKEPQYTFWTWSFLNACASNPGAASEFAGKFARFILGMDHTDGDGTAVRVLPELMEGAVRAPAMAASIFRRLVASDLVNWETLTGITITALAKAYPELAGMLTHAIGRLEGPFLFGPATKSIEATLSAITPNERPAAAVTLANEIAIFTPISDRASTLEAIVGVVPESESVVRPLIEAAEHMCEVMSLKDRSESSDQGHSRDIKADSLAELVAKGDGKSEYGTGVDYTYCRTAQALMTKSSKAEIQSFLSARPIVEKDVKLMAAAATRMLDLGDRDVAVALFGKAEAEAYTGHWSAFMGGEKLAVQKLRIALNGGAGRDAGFDRLVDELTTGQTAASNLFLNLDDVLELVTDDMPHEGWWRATQEHLQNYREYRLAEPVVAAGDITSPVDLVALLVATAFETDCSKLVEHARAVAVACFSHELGEPFAKKLFELLKTQSNGQREAAALLRGMASIERLQAVTVEEAREASRSSDFVVASIGQHVLMELGEEVEPQPTTRLPAFYDLVSVPSPSDDDFEVPAGLNPGERPMWSDDPWTWTTMLRRPLRLLARASGYSVGMLRRRCAEFMRQEGGRAAFGPEVEDRVVERLKRLQLRMPYHRQLPIAALRGVGRLLRELASADAVDLRIMPLIWDEIGGPALSGFIQTVERRPEWWEPPAIPQRQHGGLEREEWLASDDGLSSRILPDSFILAESSRMKVSVWGDTAEFSHTTLLTGSDLEHGISGLPSLISCDVLHPTYGREDSQIVCRVPSDIFGDLDRSVVTLCPYLLERMGWERTEDPFVIVDQNGAEVARTVVWDDGTDITFGREERMFVTGQALIITPDARRQLSAEFGPINSSVRVVRSVTRESGDETERVMTAA